MPKILSIIVAVDKNNGIGKDNQLLTYISADLKRFKSITKNHTIIMGKNTWLSLPRRPLPHRTNIVLTSNHETTFEGAVTVTSIEAAIDKCPENEESFIIGGASIYEQFLPLADKLYLTKIDKEFEADTFFPVIKKDEWREVDRVDVNDDEQAEVDYSFVDLLRVFVIPHKE